MKSENRKGEVSDFIKRQHNICLKFCRTKRDTLCFLYAILNMFSGGRKRKHFSKIG